MLELHVNGYLLEIAEAELEQFVGDNVWTFDYQGRTYFHPDKFSAARNKTSAIWMDAVGLEVSESAMNGETTSRRSQNTWAMKNPHVTTLYTALTIMATTRLVMFAGPPTMNRLA